VTPEALTSLIQALTALCIAVTALVGALVAIYVQLRQTHSIVNSRMTELVEATRQAASAQGELVGRRAASTGVAPLPPPPHD
jgi:hypothetical protein